MNKKTCAVCGKKFINEYHIKRHMEVTHKEDTVTPRQDKRKGWYTPLGFVDFREPVTYEEAIAFMEVFSRNLEKRDLGSKP